MGNIGINNLSGASGFVDRGPRVKVDDIVQQGAALLEQLAEQLQAPEQREEPQPQAGPPPRTPTRETSRDTLTRVTGDTGMRTLESALQRLLDAVQRRGAEGGAQTAPAPTPQIAPAETPAPTLTPDGDDGAEPQPSPPTRQPSPPVTPGPAASQGTTAGTGPGGGGTGATAGSTAAAATPEAPRRPRRPRTAATGRNRTPREAPAHPSTAPRPTATPSGPQAPASQTAPTQVQAPTTARPTQPTPRAGGSEAEARALLDQARSPDRTQHGIGIAQISRAAGNLEASASLHELNDPARARRDREHAQQIRGWTPSARADYEMGTGTQAAFVRALANPDANPPDYNTGLPAARALTERARSADPAVRDAAVAEMRRAAENLDRAAQHFDGTDRGRAERDRNRARAVHTLAGQYAQGHGSETSLRREAEAALAHPDAHHALRGRPAQPREPETPSIRSGRWM